MRIIPRGEWTNTQDVHEALDIAPDEVLVAVKGGSVVLEPLQLEGATHGSLDGRIKTLPCIYHVPPYYKATTIPTPPSDEERRFEEWYKAQHLPGKFETSFGLARSSWLARAKQR